MSEITEHFEMYGNHLMSLHFKGLEHLHIHIQVQLAYLKELTTKYEHFIETD